VNLWNLLVVLKALNCVNIYIPFKHIHTYIHTHNRYVALKQKAARSCGIDTIDYRLSENAAESDVLYCVNLLNDDPDVDGILVQLPLPPHLDQADILAAISVDKDGNCLFSSFFSTQTYIHLDICFNEHMTNTFFFLQVFFFFFFLPAVLNI
jgi:hypothetical protein